MVSTMCCHPTVFDVQVAYLVACPAVSHQDLHLGSRHLGSDSSSLVLGGKSGPTPASSVSRRKQRYATTRYAKCSVPGK